MTTSTSVIRSQDDILRETEEIVREYSRAQAEYEKDRKRCKGLEKDLKRTKRNMYKVNAKKIGLRKRNAALREQWEKRRFQFLGYDIFEFRESDDNSEVGSCDETREMSTPTQSRTQMGEDDRFSSPSP